jgi:hypothetical protein
MQMLLEVDNLASPSLLEAIQINREIGTRTSTASLSMFVDSTAVVGTGAVYDGSDDYDTSGSLYSFNALPIIQSKILFKDLHTGAVQFRGFATIIDKTSYTATQSRWDITAQGFDILLDHSIINKKYTQKKDYEIIADAFGALIPLDVLVDHDHVATISPPFDYDASDKTLRQLMDDMASIWGADWFVNAEDSALIYQPNGSIHAPFGFADGADVDFSSYFPWRVAKQTLQATAFANRVVVLGGIVDPANGRAIRGVANDLVSQAAFVARNAITGASAHSIWEIQVVNRDLLAQDQVNAAAVVELNSRKIQNQLFWEFDDDGFAPAHPAIALEVGMMVPIKSPALGINAEYKIQTLQIKQVTQTRTTYNVQAGLLQPNLGTLIGGFAPGLSGGGGLPQATFIFGTVDIPNLVVGSSTDFAIVHVGGTLTGWDAAILEAPTGADAIFDILRISDTDPTGTSIFAPSGSPAVTHPKVVIPAGVIALQSGVVADGTVVLTAGDRLQGKITQIGSANPGKVATVNLYWQ